MRQQMRIANSTRKLGHNFKARAALAKTISKCTQLKTCTKNKIIYFSAPAPDPKMKHNKFLYNYGRQNKTESSNSVLTF